MKIDDIAKQLANKINQEHYIKHYLEKVQRGAYNKGIKDAEAKQLNLCGVSQQRELLFLALNLAEELPRGMTSKQRYKIVDDIIKNNCG